MKSIWRNKLTLLQPCKFCPGDFWFNQQHYVTRWVSIISWKSKNETTWIFAGEWWNTDVSVADILGAFETTWVCPLDLNRTHIISGPFMTHLREENKVSAASELKSHKLSNIEPLQISLGKW
jgi:hypothetical protein